MHSKNPKTDFDKLKTPNDLMEFMNKYVKYGFVAKDGKKYYDPDDKEWDKHWYPECIVQSHEGMLDTLCGTCWDQVELEREWFKRYNYKFETIYIQFEIHGENSYPTHSFLTFNKNNKWYWFEHSFGSYRGIHEFDSLENLIEHAKNKQIELAIKICNAKPSDRESIKVWKYNTPPANASVEEYICHVTGNI